MSYSKIYIHAVWTTKNRRPRLSKETMPRLSSHIRSTAAKKGIIVDCVNGYYDHLHCLFLLPATMSLADAMQHLKGESSRWLNLTFETDDRFRWARRYFAAGVSVYGIEKVRNYIYNQWEHHRNETFEDEYERFLQKHGYCLYTDQTDKDDPNRAKKIFDFPPEKKESKTR